MNSIGLIFVLSSAVALLVLPRRWAPLPLMAATCYMTVDQRVDLGPFTFTVLRILVALGVMRVAVRGEALVGRTNRLDVLIVIWSAWLCLSGVFHQNPAAALVTRLGTVYDVCGIYFLLRIFCSSLEDIERLSRTAAIILVPVAVEMVYEQIAFHNLFSILGGPATPMLREGRIRAFGPFAHAILAGSVGAVTLPLMMGLWRSHRLSALVGIGACLTMVVASASSGPASSALIAVVAVCMWRLRGHMRTFRWMLVAVYGVLTIVMTRPPYYLIQRFELVGGSTGWYRSRLIELAFEHIGEWWLAGTDYTRHWIWYGNAINENHVDITNHYLVLGITGGLTLLFLHIGILSVAFSYVGQGVAVKTGTLANRHFMLWTMGCALLSHTVTNLSVSYFDQSFLFLYLTLAAISSAHTVQQLAPATDALPVVTKVQSLRTVRPGWPRVSAPQKS